MRHWRPTQRFLAELVFVCVTYFAAGQVGLAVPFTDANISPVWLPAGFAVACVLMFGFRIWPAIFAGAFLTNYFSPIPHIAAVGIATGNMLAAVTTGYLLKRASFDTQLKR